MTPENLPEHQSHVPVIESPSGTTDPNNRHSGVGAYVIFAIAVCLLALLLLSVTSCVSTLGAVVSSSYDEHVVDMGDSDDLDWLEEELTDDYGWSHHEPLSRA